MAQKQLEYEIALEEVKSNHSREVREAVRAYKEELEAKDDQHRQEMEQTDQRHRMVVAAFAAKPFKSKNDRSLLRTNGKASPNWKDLSLTPFSSVNNSLVKTSPKYREKQRSILKQSATEEHIFTSQMLSLL